MSKRQRPEYVNQRIARRDAELQSFGDLAKAVRIILMQEWDPCGINDVPRCADEYDSYIPSVCRLICDGRTVDDLTNYLHWVEVEQMAMHRSDAKDSRRVAELLRQLAPKDGHSDA